MISPDNPCTITPHMSVLDVVSRYRQTEAVFKRYDAAAGACICCNALFETLAEVADRYRINLEALIGDLEQVIHQSVQK